MKLIDLLEASTRKHPSNAAVKNDIFEVSYKKLLSDVYTLSEHLQLIGCKEGINTTIVLGNCIEYFVSFFAVSAAGGCILPLSIRMTPYETMNFIKRSDVSILITNPTYSKCMLEAFDNSYSVSVINITYESKEKLKIETLSQGLITEHKETQDVALMVHTSGTTGVPKIVMLTDDQLISNMFIYRSLMTFDTHNVAYCSLLLHHIYCICAQVLTHIYLGDTFILKDSPFFIKDFFKAVETYKVTITAFVPYMAMLLAEYEESEHYNLKSLKYVTLSGAKTPKSTYIALMRKFPHIQFINTYGMSEAGSRISIAAPLPDCFPIESVGLPMVGVKVRVVDDDGSVLGANTVGEIEVKSSGVMKGYYKQKELTSLTVVDGWLKTGDLGKMDVDSNLFLVGRKKDIIISGGENIYPLEIEQRLMEHPCILEAVVVGQEHKRLQEVPVAFLVKRNGTDVTIPELKAFCTQYLSGYKIPRFMIFLANIPKLGTSKIDRHKLTHMLKHIKQ